jgi:hypothetical protein
VKPFLVLVRYCLLADPFQNNVCEFGLRAGYPETTPLPSVLQQIRRRETNPTFNTVLTYHIQDAETGLLFIDMANSAENLWHRRLSGGVG